MPNRERREMKSSEREKLIAAAQMHIDALERLLVVYRTGMHSRGAAAADKVNQTREKWEALRGEE